MAEVVLEGISKCFGNRRVVQDLSLRVPDGSFTVFVGPSGCGKSTILRMIAGLEHIDGGRLWIGGRDVTRAPAQQRELAMVFQSYALYPHMTAYRNMAFGLQKTSRLSKTEIDQRVRQAAEKLAITHLLDKKPASLSGGERQRVAIGRALVRKPRVYLFDEPLSNLDAKLRHHMRAELRKLQQELQITVIYVTHDQVEAMTLGDQVVIFNQGRLQQVGPPMQLYDSPENMFVASFIGSPEMNFLSCDVRAEAERCSVHYGAYAASLPARNGIDEHARIVLGVRPEELSVASQAQADVQGVVQYVELLGADALAHVVAEQGELVVRLPTAQAPQVGQPIGLALGRGRLRLFDARTGHRVQGGDLLA